MKRNNEQDLGGIPYFPGGICDIGTDAWTRLVNKKKATMTPPGVIQPNLPITFVAKVVEVRAHTSKVTRASGHRGKSAVYPGKSRALR